MLINCISNGRAKCCNVYCRYSMINRVIDSRVVRAQKAQSTGSSSVRRRSEDELEIIRL
jgi:hypothetical protein